MWRTLLAFLIAAGVAYLGARVCWRVLTFPFRYQGLPRWLAALLAALNVGAGLIASLYLAFFLTPLVVLPFLLLFPRGPGDIEPLTPVEAVPVAGYLISVFLTLGIWLTGWVQRLLTRELSHLVGWLRHRRQGAAAGHPRGGEPP